MRIRSFAIVFAACLAFGAAVAQERRIERLATGLIEDGQPVSLELVFYRPPGAGPFPTLMFHHGSVGNGNDPAEVTHTVSYPALAAYFNERGWLVVFPQRRGRGKSDGRYAEGWQPARGRYACDPPVSLAGLERALEDSDAVLSHLRRRPDVDTRRMLTGGHSKGGILALAHAARRPDDFVAAINFVGGWVGERCDSANEINGGTFSKAAGFHRPTLWLYGENDPFYSNEHSRRNFDAFRAAGGDGRFHLLSPGALSNGHQLVRGRAIWEATLTAFMATLE